MKKLLLVIGIAVGALGIYLGFRLLRSDEARIRDLLGAMADGFNDGSASGASAGLDEAYVDETTKIRREDVKMFLRWLYLTARDETTKELRYRVEVADVQVRIEPGAQKAAVQLEAKFFELRSKVFQPVWTVKIEGDLAKQNGWKVVSSRHQSISGKRPF